MIHLKTLLNCIDNSGAAVVECINVLRNPKGASLGDRIVVVVQRQRSLGPEAAPRASPGGGGSSASVVSSANRVRRGDIRHAVLVRTRQPVQRPDGSVVRFDDNACVLINKSGDPIGTRINGLVASELKENWGKILSLAPFSV